MKNKFDKYAKMYNPFMRFYRLYNEKAIEEMIDINNTKSLLDVGAGTCHYANYFSGAIKDIHAVDISTKMLEKANSLVQTKVHDITTGLPYEDASFDVVIMCDFLHHTKRNEHKLILDEIHRVLRKNGTFIMYDFNNKKVLTILIRLLENILFFQRMNYLDIATLRGLTKTLFTEKKLIQNKSTFIYKGEKI